MFQNEALPFPLSKIPPSLQAVEKFPLCLQQKFIASCGTVRS